MGELLLGIDIGTSSSKGVLARPDGTILADAQRPHEPSRPRPGWAEMDADAVWWGDVVSICEELLPQADDDLAGVGVSGMGPCVLAADAEGEPLRPAILYGIDARATAEIEELTERYGAEAILARGGSPLTTQAVGPKLLWLQRNEPEVWERTERLLHVSSFVVGRLTGEYALDHHSASQSDPLYDITANEWVAEWAEDIAPGLALPRLLWPHEVAGEVTKKAAETTGIPAGTPVVAGTQDTWAEAASVGVREAGDVMLMYGTTMFVVEVLTEARPDPHLWSTTSLGPGTRNLSAGMATSGALGAWWRSVAGEAPWEELEAEAEAVAAGADGLVALPYFSGERAPLFDARARGAILGLTLRHGRGHVFRALMEGTAYGLRHNLETMAAAGGGGVRIVAVGGGLQAQFWIQAVSDVTGRTQGLPAKRIGASFGDAFFAAVGTGLASPEDRWNHVEGHVEPRPEATEAYETPYRVYRELYPALKEQMHTLADLQAGPAGPAAAAPPATSRKAARLPSSPRR